MSPTNQNAAHSLKGAEETLPSTTKAWKEDIQINGLTKSSLKSVSPKSGSKATLAQFYMLKTLCLPTATRHQLRRDLHLHIKPDALAKAKALLKGSALWAEYESSFDSAARSEGLFGLVQLYQRRCNDRLRGDFKPDLPRGRLRYTPEASSSTATGRRVGYEEAGSSGSVASTAESAFTSAMSDVSVDALAKKLEVEDEEIVNFALVLFLNALVRATPAEDVHGDWWPCRSAFRAPNKEHKAYEAAVDGVFRVEGATTDQNAKQYVLRTKYQALRHGAGQSADFAKDAPRLGTPAGKKTVSGSGVPHSPRKSTARGNGRGGDKRRDAGTRGTSGLTPSTALPTRTRPIPARPSKSGNSGNSGVPAEEAVSSVPAQPSHDSSKLQNTRNITVILEVKRASRANEKRLWRQNVLIQEAAQMAAWIAEVPMLLGQKPNQNREYRRLLLSQDQREIFVTIATYTEEYINYIMNSVDRPVYRKALLRPDSFLRMRSYGSFCVDQLEHMQLLAELLIALSYQNYVI
ncbi:hypothetical protein IF1G_06647 [Cordyceps javanica]|uniref:Uncharacterized protein n=1 Tax=Cordyceps javanica TaxID=43265 RepID=A0A545UYV9_9HYPO|nr:hypothetical protein IF1G_06647 [Cordyceps javanica]TQW06507.1 hypothetical protein IF2G_05929 [Cordyceps javanica]